MGKLLRLISAAALAPSLAIGVACSAEAPEPTRVSSSLREAAHRALALEMASSPEGTLGASSNDLLDALNRALERVRSAEAAAEALPELRIVADRFSAAELPPAAKPAPDASALQAARLRLDALPRWQALDGNLARLGEGRLETPVKEPLRELTRTFRRVAHHLETSGEAEAPALPPIPGEFPDTLL